MESHETLTYHHREEHESRVSFYDRKLKKLIHKHKNFAPFNFSKVNGAIFTPLPEDDNIPTFSGEEDPQEHLLTIECLTCGESYNKFNRVTTFASSLIGEAREWYFSLPATSISSWEELLETFEKRWCHENIMVQLYKGFLSIERRNDESVVEFNHRFNSIIHAFPCNLTCPREITLAVYLNSFTGKLALIHELSNLTASSKPKISYLTLINL